MPEEQVVRQRSLGKDRQLVTPLDTVRAAEFFVGSLASGAHLSAGGLTLKAVSSPVRIRPLNVEVYNTESVWYELEFRDGGFLGGRVLGPYRVNAYSEKFLDTPQLAGHYFTSSVYVMALSGGAATMTSGAGIRVNMGVLQDPQDFYE